MAQAVGQVCCHDTDDCSYDEYWNTACLCLLGFVAELLDDGGYEELQGIPSILKFGCLET